MRKALNLYGLWRKCRRAQPAFLRFPIFVTLNPAQRACDSNPKPAWGLRPGNSHSRAVLCLRQTRPLRERASAPCDFRFPLRCIPHSGRVTPIPQNPSPLRGGMMKLKSKKEKQKFLYIVYPAPRFASTVCQGNRTDFYEKIAQCIRYKSVENDDEMGYNRRKKKYGEELF